MPRVNGTSLGTDGRLPDQVRRHQAEAEAGTETLALNDALRLLPDILVAALPERVTPKTSRNSRLPPSQTDRDGTARRTGKSFRGRTPKARETESGNLRTFAATGFGFGRRVPAARPRPVLNRVPGTRGARRDRHRLGERRAPCAERGRDQALRALPGVDLPPDIGGARKRRDCRHRDRNSKNGR